MVTLPTKKKEFPLTIFQRRPILFYSFQLTKNVCNHYLLFPKYQFFLQKIFLISHVSEEEGTTKPEAMNKRAVQIVNRVKDKLTGRDFNKDEAIDVEKQVDLLIQQATSHANLCQAYIGW